MNLLHLHSDLKNIDPCLKAKHHKQAFTDLQKRGNSLNEEMQKMLESLDAVTLLDDQQGNI